MALQLTGDSLNRKVYQDNTNWNLTVEVKKTVQPVRRRINGNVANVHVQVHEYTVRDIECLAHNACDPTAKVENPALLKLRVSGGVNSEKLESLYATLQKAIASSGGVNSPTLSAVKSW